MNLEKLFNEFIADVKKEGTYASKEELIQACKPMLDIIKNNKNATPEELVGKIIKSDIDLLEEIRTNYHIPGYTVGLSVGNINVKIIGGDIDSNGRKMAKDALFDVASITKLYTEIIAYNLIDNHTINLIDKIKKLDSRFVNVGGLKVSDVLSFTVSFKKDEKIYDKKTVEEAKRCLYNVAVTQIGEYNYNDVGMMIMKEVMEAVTGKKYSELLNEYILDKLDLSETFLTVPKDKLDLLTGTPNANLGSVNDPSANALGGYSGHAGIKASSDDLIKLGYGLEKGIILPKYLLEKLSTPGIKYNRNSTFGCVYVATGKTGAYISKLAPKSEIAVQGSTRVQANFGRNSQSTILLNPSSMSIKQARELENKLNETRIKTELPPIPVVEKQFDYDRNGKIVKYNLIDARKIIDTVGTVVRITDKNAEVVLCLRFLNKVMQFYNKNKYVNIILAKY